MPMDTVINAQSASRLPEASELQRLALTPSVTRPEAAIYAHGRFHIPFEHGAWWSFVSTLLGGLIVALASSVPPLTAVALSLALFLGFLSQDWAQALLAKLMDRRSQALSSWDAWQGWALAFLAAAAATVVLFGTQATQRWAWALGFGVAALLMSLVLLSRLTQSGRGRRTLALSSLLLALPALPLGILAFGPSAKALSFWIWPTLYYPAVTLTAQAYIRGSSPRARYLGPSLGVLLALAALSAGGNWVGGLWLLASVRQTWVLRQRWRLQPVGMPAGGAIRAFGKEQAAWGVTLTLIWIAYYLI